MPNLLNRNDRICLLEQQTAAATRDSDELKMLKMSRTRKRSISSDRAACYSSRHTCLIISMHDTADRCVTAGHSAARNSRPRAGPGRPGLGGPWTGGTYYTNQHRSDHWFISPQSIAEIKRDSTLPSTDRATLETTLGARLG